jgi:hypothetical protein
MAYVELHLSKDPEWKKCAKMMSLPVKMPDVLRKYRLTKRLVDDLEDGTLTGDNVQYTIRRVRKNHLFSCCQAL